MSPLFGIIEYGGYTATSFVRTALGATEVTVVTGIFLRGNLLSAIIRDINDNRIVKHSLFSQCAYNLSHAIVHGANHVLINATILGIGHVFVVTIRTSAVGTERRIVGSLHRNVHGVLGNHQEEGLFLRH